MLSCTISASAVKWLRRAICRETRRIVGKTARTIDAVYIYNGTIHFCAHEHRGVIVPFANVRQKRAGFGGSAAREQDFTREGNSANLNFTSLLNTSLLKIFIKFTYQTLKSFIELQIARDLFFAYIKCKHLLIKNEFSNNTSIFEINIFKYSWIIDTIWKKYMDVFILKL